MWTEWYSGDWPYKHFSFEDEYTVDLLTGIITPDREGDDVEKYSKAMSKWFLQALEKEKISFEVIESAQIIAKLPDSYNCIIKAGGRTFEAYEKRNRKRERERKRRQEKNI
jgi:hypothetical protein